MLIQKIMIHRYEINLNTYGIYIINSIKATLIFLLAIMDYYTVQWL